MVFCRYDFDLDRWIMLVFMVIKWIGVGVVVVNRLLFVVGGYDGSNRLRSMECYDLERDEWYFVVFMNIIRSGVGKFNGYVVISLIFGYLYICINNNVGFLL